MKKYKITLTRDEIDELKALTKRGKCNARTLKNALILLNVDEGENGRGKKDEDVADILQVTVRTIENIRKRFIVDGFEAALYGKLRQRTYDRKVDGDAEARLIAMCCSEPPEGHATWSLRLLADKMVELQYVDSISHETVRRVLKKTN